MSLKDGSIEINDSYKKYDGGWLGHNLFLLAENKEGVARYYGSVHDLYGQCGPIIIVNENDQRWAQACVVNFDYEVCEHGIDTDIIVRSDKVTHKGWTQVVGTESGSVTITAGTKGYHQISFTDHYIHKITALTIDDTLQNVKIYCMADDGIRLLQGFNENEINRAMLDIIEASQWVSPPPCPLCDGTGEYPEGTECPDCLGYKFDGKNAQEQFLVEKAYRFNIKQRDETDESFQWRAWAQQWWMIPTKTRIKEYIAHFTKVDVSRISIEEHYFPEAYWIIRLPIFSLGTQAVGNLLSVDDNTYDELLESITPAGTSVIIREFYEFGDLDIFEERGLIETDVSVDNNARSSWGMDWLDGNWWLDGVGEAVDESVFDTHKPFYADITLEEYIEYQTYDQAWVAFAYGVDKNSDANIV